MFWCIIEVFIIIILLFKFVFILLIYSDVNQTYKSK